MQPVQGRGGAEGNTTKPTNKTTLSRYCLPWGCPLLGAHPAPTSIPLHNRAGAAGCPGESSGALGAAPQSPEGPVQPERASPPPPNCSSPADLAPPPPARSRPSSPCPASRGLVLGVPKITRGSYPQGNGGDMLGGERRDARGADWARSRCSAPLGSRRLCQFPAGAGASHGAAVPGV